MKRQEISYPFMNGSVWRQLSGTFQNLPAHSECEFLLILQIEEIIKIYNYFNMFDIAECKIVDQNTFPALATFLNTETRRRTEVCWYIAWKSGSLRLVLDGDVNNFFQTS